MEQFFDVAGMLVDFLIAPNEIDDGLCLLRGVTRPGVVEGSLHSHPEPEIVYVLEGSLQVFHSDTWSILNAGEAAKIPGGIKHALRNSALAPVISLAVAGPELCAFLREVAIPLDRHQEPNLSTDKGIRVLLQTAARYGFWMGSPEENAAIGLSLG